MGGAGWHDDLPVIRVNGFYSYIGYLANTYLSGGLAMPHTAASCWMPMQHAQGKRGLDFLGYRWGLKPGVLPEHHTGSCRRCRAAPASSGLCVPLQDRAVFAFETESADRGGVQHEVGAEAGVVTDPAAGQHAQDVGVGEQGGAPG